jgi:uncharacterized protein YgbK (DUF1537 family)
MCKRLFRGGKISTYIRKYLTRMYENADEVIKALPAEPKADLLPLIRREFLQSEKTVVVLDDDPTGTQTCYDVVVLTSWSVPLIVGELEKNPSILFILTNSRSLPERHAIELAHEIGCNLREAKKESGRNITLISRSDSTLRGHFPAEVDAVASAFHASDAVRVLVPAFIEGGRFTINDIHYVREDNKLIPVSDTPFARDAVFGYTHSNMKAWVEEKTKGKVNASEVISISISDLREGGAGHVTEKLRQCKPGDVCIVNACSHQDLAVLVVGLLQAGRQGQKFIYRTSATFVPIRAGLKSGRLFQPTRHDNSGHGSLVIVGSYVPKTTTQLENLLSQNTHYSLEVSVPEILRSDNRDSYAKTLISETEELLSIGKHVVIHTSRALEKGPDAESSLAINSMVSSFLVNIVNRLAVRPAFIVAKGGITSSDIASKALRAKKAVVLGQIIPGVPVWKMDVDSKFPEILFVVFPGNVGDEFALADVCKKLNV